MMLTNPERIQIRQLLQTPQWQTAERVANEMCDDLAKDTKLRDTEWETLKTTVYDEGQLSGIKRLIKELYNIAQNT